jgi:ribosomal protein L32E
VEDCQGVSEFISKLKALLLLVLAPALLNDGPTPTIEFGSPDAEKSNAEVVNIGLSAMIVSGILEVNSVLPKPKSIRIALSVAVD